MKNYLSKIVLILIIFFESSFIFSQEILVRDQYCSYISNDKESTFLKVVEPDKNSHDVIGLILKYSGLDENYKIKTSNDIPNAEASIKGELRYVIFNPFWIAKLKENVKSDWSTASIMAHELGHHLNGHTLGSGGSRKDFELKADKFSGHILQRMGATIEDALAAMKMVGEHETRTHPAREDRLSAIMNGWKEAERLKMPDGHGKKPDKEHLVLKDYDEDKTLEGKKAAHSFDASEDLAENKKEDEIYYVARIVLDNDIEEEYFITNTNEIVGFNDFDQPVVVGDVDDADNTLNKVHVYRFYLNDEEYFVDDEGNIWIINEKNEWEEVGYVTDDN